MFSSLGDTIYFTDELYVKIAFFVSTGIITYYVMGKIVSEGHIRNSETYLWARCKAEGLIKWSRWFLICPRDDFNHNIHNFISRLRINLCPGIHKRQERYKIVYCIVYTCNFFYNKNCDRKVKFQCFLPGMMVLKCTKML